MILRVWDVTFTVADLQQAVDFYQNTLGLQIKYQFSNYAGLDCGGMEIGLVPGRANPPQQDAPCVDFLVLRARGVHFVKEPHDTPWGGRIALLADPDGHLLQLVQIKWPQYFQACSPQ
jgi:catechol 2,3-dioxygenase-like lactoylglutathione lyase family enzyme